MAYKRKSPMPVTEGGTGIQTATIYAPICGNGTGGFVVASSGQSVVNSVLTSNGASAFPSWQAGGGTGTVTNLVNGNNISITGSTPTVNPTVNVSGTTQYALQVGTSAGALSSLSLGTLNQVLTSQGAGSNPIWTNPITTGTIAFQAFLATNTGTPLSSPYVMGSTVALTTEFNVGSGFYAGNGSGTPASFTAPITGIYSFNFSATGNSSIGGIPMPKPQIVTPTSSYFASSDTGGGVSVPLQQMCQATVSLNAGDVVKFQVNLSSINGFYIQGGAVQKSTWVNGFLV